MNTSISLIIKKEIVQICLIYYIQCLMKPICFIGARRGSKGISRKNLRNFGGKPLIAYAVESAVKSKLYNHVVVSTEDKVIAKIAKKHGAEGQFLLNLQLCFSFPTLMMKIFQTIKIVA